MVKQQSVSHPHCSRHCSDILSLFKHFKVACLQNFHQSHVGKFDMGAACCVIQEQQNMLGLHYRSAIESR
jgi:hypothetical protein